MTDDRAPFCVYDRGIGYEVHDKNDEPINAGFRDTFRKADAELICEALNIAHETGLTPRQLTEQRAELLAALKHTARVLSDWHHTDFNETVADGGVTASDVIRQECGWHAARINAVIANVEHGS